jgi:phospholipase/carboxylesterase
MRLVSLRNYVALGVRGPAPQGTGFHWPQDANAIETADQRVCEAVAAARERFNVHPERIFLAGYDAAGTMALRLALRNPDLFAGAASLNGTFPQAHAPLARLADIRGLKLMIAHCRDSERYSVNRLCRELSLFHSASLSVHLRQYPCQDELTTQMLHDLDGWLMEQVTGLPAASEDTAASVESDWN